MENIKKNLKHRPVNSSFDSTAVVLGQNVAYFILDTC